MRAPFGGVYHGRRVLVTGHTGFKGSWLCAWLKSLGATVGGLSLPVAGEPAHWSVLQLDLDSEFICDVRGARAVAAALVEFRPEIVFHLAAQALVRRSYREPLETFSTNVLGTLHVLDAVRSTPSVRVVVNATTDKVYRDRITGSGYQEGDPLGGDDPYSASKACSELVSECYRKSFLEPALGAKVGIATARAGNVIGGGDWSEDRILPDAVRANLAGEPLRVRNPLATRPWQHVLDPLSGYLSLASRLFAGEAFEGAWNFGPDSGNSCSVEELLNRFSEHWPGLVVEKDPGPHPKEAHELRLDCSKARKELGWSAVWDVDQSVERTVSWYRNFHEQGIVSTAEDISHYLESAKSAGKDWAGSSVC